MFVIESHWKLNHSLIFLSYDLQKKLFLLKSRSNLPTISHRNWNQWSWLWPWPSQPSTFSAFTFEFLLKLWSKSLIYVDKPFIANLAEFWVFFLDYLIKSDRCWPTYAEFTIPLPWMSFKIIINLVIYIYTRRYFLISFKSIRSFLIRFSNLCWWYVDTMQKLTVINEGYGFFFEYLFKAWWFFQLDLMAVVVTVDVTVVCFLSFFLWISFKVMIEKADLCLWPIRNPPWKVPVFFTFLWISYKI